MSQQELVPYNANDLLPYIPEPQTKKRLTRVTIPQAMSTQHLAAGGVGKLFLDFQSIERPNEYAPSMRVYLIDGDLKSRTMWPFGSDGRTDLSNKTPWCASSDAERPRGGTFGYIGKSYVDWRDGKTVTIGTECKGCKFSQFIPVFKDGKAVIDPKTGRQLQGRSPCQLTPQYVFWDLDRKLGFIIQASNPTVRQFMEGGRVKNAGGNPAYIQISGVNSFYTPTAKTQDGKFITPTMPDGVTPHALVLSVQTHMNGYGSATFVPTFKVGEKLSDEEIDELRDQINLYRQPIDETGLTLRDKLLGRGYEENVDPDGGFMPTEEDTPF